MAFGQRWQVMSLRAGIPWERSVQVTTSDNTARLARYSILPVVAYLALLLEYTSESREGKASLMLGIFDGQGLS